MREKVSVDISQNWGFFEMNKYLKITVSLLQVLGGLLGIALICINFLSGQLTMIGVMFNFAFVLVFAFGIMAGVVLIKKEKPGILLSMIFQAMQIPVLIGPKLSYILFTGACFNIYKHAMGFGFDFYFGSRYYFNINSGEPWLTGINIVALVLFILLLRASMFGAASAQSIGPQPGLADSADHSAQSEDDYLYGSPVRFRH
jgi:hypothetical protein